MAAAIRGRLAPAQLTDIHHNSDYARSRRTAIDDLTLRCGPRHRLRSGGWRTRKRGDGAIETCRRRTSTAAGHASTATTTWTLLCASADDEDPEDP